MRPHLPLLLASALAFPALVWAQPQGSHNAEVARNLETFDEIYKLLDTYYVDTLSADTVITSAIDAMLASVDPFTSYHPQDDEELTQMAEGKYAGIGSVIRMSRRERRAVVSEPYEGTPSWTAGMRAGDVILSVDGVDTEGLSLEEVTSRLRGEAGTKVEVKVRRLGVKDPLLFTLMRKSIQLPQVPFYTLLPGDTIGYILLTGFTQGAYMETRRALLDLRARGMRRLVLDLRDNPGGALDEAVNIVNLFVAEGRQVVTTRGKMPSANRDYRTSSEAVDTLMPLVVLVDGGSASASEIVAGSLQDMDRAVILGSRTYGKGLVQSIHELPYGGNLKLTISRYYIPSGRCIQAYDYRHLASDGSAGVVPDSLTREFTTRAGRRVRDGGGIKPDVEVVPDSLPTYVYDLVEGEEMFNYATRYAASHERIAPAGEFDIGDEDYEAFVGEVVADGFVANRRSEKVLELLRSAVELEGRGDELADVLDTLDARLGGDIGADLMRWKAEVKPYLNTEIVSRYEFQRGTCRQALGGDKALDAAVRLLGGDDEEYYNILKP